MNDSEAGVLYVDLDGTLMRSDASLVSMLGLLKLNPIMVLNLAAWLLRGRAYFKREVARRVDIDPGNLPWTAEFVDYLRTCRREGRRIVLITASDQKYADSVADHLKLFDDAIGSDGVTNLSGARKLERILADCAGAEFAYAGNSGRDLEIWPHGNEAIVVNALPSLLKKAQATSNVVRVFSPITGLADRVLRAARYHQWLKNLLLFVPLVVSHRITEWTLLLQGLTGFIAFGLCASAVYLLNDLFDLDDDRSHPTKRNRPIASGDMPLDLAALLIPVLLLGALLSAALLPSEFLAVLAAYFIITLGYSLRLKQIAVLDVLLLSALYTTRLLAGGAATGVAVSYWLLVFSLFFFLSLAMLKRCTEMGAHRVVAGRGYRAGDDQLLTQFGTASGYIAVLVLALYINSDQIRIQYDWPEGIWLLCPILLYWVARIWLLAHRGQMHEDPVIFAMRDRVSHVLIGLSMMILWIAA
jgi:4-hydroxybenzoate polyprenyltransferase/phosphoserine phosphatase